MEISEAIKKYTAGELPAEELNAILKDAGAGFSFQPGQNALTAEEIAETVVGIYPDDANGWGLLDTGTGTLDKVHVTDGKLNSPINTVEADGTTSMRAYVTIGGRRYEVYGDELGPVAAPETPDWVQDPPPLWAVPWQEELPKYIPDEDMLFRPEYANRTVRKGQLRYRYDGEGHATYAPVSLARYDKDHGRDAE